MAGYVQLGDVNTWYDEDGEGEPLVLLHPGGADARAFAPNIDAMAARFQVFTPERRGHGHTPDVDGPITYELMATDTIAFLETVVGGPAHLVALQRRDARGAAGRAAPSRPGPPPGPHQRGLPP
jgi:pimeloyl-ACP methyl ester carboxylesterase